MRKNIYIYAYVRVVQNLAQFPTARRMAHFSSPCRDCTPRWRKNCLSIPQLQLRSLPSQKKS